MDFLSRQLTTVKPDIKRYNIAISNPTLNLIEANYYEQLAGPLLDDASKYMCGIERCRVSTTNIPLSRTNIPFQQWQVGIGYNASGSGYTYKTAYVDQINQQYRTLNRTYCVSSSSGINQTNNSFTNIISTYPIPSPVSSALPPAYDFATGTNGTIYYISSNTQSIYCVDLGTGNLLQTITSPNGLTDYTINSVYADPASGTLYIGVWNNAGIAPNYWQACIYTRSANVWTYSSSLTSSDISTYMYSIVKIGNLLFIASFPPVAGTVYVIVFNLGTSSQVNNISLGSTFNAQMRTDGTYLYLADSIGGQITKYSIDSIGNLTSVQVYNLNLALLVFNSFTGFDDTGKIIFLNNNNQYQYTDNQILNLPVNTYLVINGNPYQSAIDSPNQIITTYQQYLNKINSAFLSAYQQFTAGGTFVSTAPIISYNQSANDFVIICDEAYSDQTKYRIIINSTLQNLFLFPTIDVSGTPSTFVNILVQNYGYNSYAGSLIGVSQETSTTFKFFDLVRIIVKTTMPIAGDQEGFNNSENILTDILPDTTTLSPSEPIIYVPTEVRYYNLVNSGNWRTINISFWYGTKNGNIYPIELSPSDYASCKLAFLKIAN